MFVGLRAADGSIFAAAAEQMLRGVVYVDVLFLIDCMSDSGFSWRNADPPFPPLFVWGRGAQFNQLRSILGVPPENLRCSTAGTPTFRPHETLERLPGLAVRVDCVANACRARSGGESERRREIGFGCFRIVPAPSRRALGAKAQESGRRAHGNARSRSRSLHCPVDSARWMRGRRWAAGLCDQSRAQHSPKLAVGKNRLRLAGESQPEGNVAPIEAGAVAPR